MSGKMDIKQWKKKGKYERHKTSKKGYQQNIFAHIINFKHSQIFIPIKIPMNEKRIVKWMPKGTITIVLGIHPKNRDLSKNIGVKNRLKSVQGGGLFLFYDTFVPEYCIKRRF